MNPAAPPPGPPPARNGIDAFLVSTPPPKRTASHDRVETALERVCAECADLSTLLAAIGPVTPATYVESALVSLRVALRAIPRAGDAQANGVDDRDDADGAVVADDGRVRIRLAEGPQPLVRRMVRRSGERAWTDDPMADLAPAPRTAPDLGVDLAASREARAIAARPVGAALLQDALGRWAWVHDRARTVWCCSPATARAITAILADGHPPADIDPAVIDGIDAAVAELIAGLGWRLRPGQCPPAP